MKKNFYLQHSLMTLQDPRMKVLISEEGLEGFGAYWFIVEKLELLPEPYAQLDYLLPFCTKQISLRYIGKIIRDYQLFIIDEEGYFTPAELNPSRLKDKKTAEIELKTAENRTENARNAAKIEENRRFLKLKTPKNTTNSCAKKANNKLNYSELPIDTPRNTKENIKDKIITAATEEKEETAAAADFSPEKFSRRSIGLRYRTGSLSRTPLPGRTFFVSSPTMTHYDGSNHAPQRGKPRTSTGQITHFSAPNHALHQQRTVWLEVVRCVHQSSP